MVLPDGFDARDAVLTVAVAVHGWQRCEEPSLAAALDAAARSLALTVATDEEVFADVVGVSPSNRAVS